MEAKICGVARPEDAVAAAELGADYVGLILAPGQRRVSVDAAGEIGRRLPPSTTPVLLFVDAPVDQVIDAARRTGIAHVQLHGSEDAAFVRRLLNAAPDLRIIRAWPVSDAASGEQLLEHISQLAALGIALHRVILDLPKHGPAPDPSLLDEIANQWPKDAPPLWRAGGLTPDSVSHAASTGLYRGVDVAKGVESSPGVKDRELMARFIANAKRRSTRR